MDWFDRIVLGFVSIGVSKLIAGWLAYLLLWLGIVIVTFSTLVFLAALTLTVMKEWVKQKTKKVMSPEDWVLKLDNPKKK